jgi:TRAP-type mannitol/chloroaromatic compound transport system permease large subunit
MYSTSEKARRLEFRTPDPSANPYLAFPAMLKQGYDVRLSAGVVCAGGCLGILIPPSIMLILFGATAGVSPVQLYAGAFFPGLMLAGLYMVYVVVRC